MPAPYAYAGILGGIVLLGVLVWSIWSNNSQEEEYYRPRNSFRPEAGYDRPRTGDWEEDENQASTSLGRRRRRRSRANCVICMDGLAGSKTRHLPCCHVFHDNCIKLWLKEKETCPSCMQKV